MRKHVDVLAGLIGPRHLGKPWALEAAAGYIEREFAAMGDEVRRESYEIRASTVSNLVVERRGASRPDRVVIVGAHYDTVPTTPGADDNASAVAMLLECARLLRDKPMAATVRFVGFTCEEPPHFNVGTMGSQHHARGCRQRGERVLGMICLEMVGYFRTDRASQAVPDAIPRLLRWAFPRSGDFLTVVGNLHSVRLVYSFRRGFKRAASFPLYSIALPEVVHDIRLSDNSSFWDEGYPAVMVTDTSHLRNPHYHLSTDAPDTLDYERLAMATVGVAGAIVHIAE